MLRVYHLVKGIHWSSRRLTHAWSKWRHSDVTPYFFAPHFEIFQLYYSFEGTWCTVHYFTLDFITIPDYAENVRQKNNTYFLIGWFVSESESRIQGAFQAILYSSITKNLKYSISVFRIEPICDDNLVYSTNMYLTVDVRQFYVTITHKLWVILTSCEINSYLYKVATSPDVF